MMRTILRTAGVLALLSGMFLSYAWYPGRMTGGGSVFRGTGTAVDSAQLDKAGRVTHGFEIHCGADPFNGDPSSTKNSLEINWKDDGGKQHRFHLDDKLVSAHCDMIDSVGSPKPPTAAFNWFEGQGTGKYDNKPGYRIHFIFTDASEPGGDSGSALPPPDTAFYDIYLPGPNDNALTGVKDSVEQVLLAGTVHEVTQTVSGQNFTFLVGGIPLTYGNHQAHDQ